jgi:hypothetical protein
MRRGASRSARFGLLTVLLLIQRVTAGTVPVRPAGAAAGWVSLTFDDGRLTADIVDAPLPQVLREIGRLSGATVTGLGNESGARISIHFTDLPVREALERVLGSRSFVVVTTGSREPVRLTRIIILPGDRELRAATAPAGEIAGNEAAGDASPDAVISAAFDSPEPGTRLEAIRSLAESVADDPRAEAILADLSRHETDPRVRQAALLAHEDVVRAHRFPEDPFDGEARREAAPRRARR